MYKKTFMIAGVIAACMLSSAAVPSAKAETPASVGITLSQFPVTVNGTAIDNKHSMYPLLVYKDITYFPMTYHYTTSLGLIPNWNPTDGLSVDKQNMSVLLQQDLTDAAPPAGSDTATLVPFPVTVNGQSIANGQEEYPLLFYRDIVYFPMTWQFTHNTFGWTTSWDAGRGFQIQTSATVPYANLAQTTALNLVNGGQLAVQGEWIYMNPANKYNGPNSLIKMKADGSEKQKVSEDNAMSINAVGDWLYYTSWDASAHTFGGIIRVKTDGSGRSVVSSVPTTRIWVHDDWIYYIKYDLYTLDSGEKAQKVKGIYKMRLDGSQDTPVAEGEGTFDFYIDGEDIFFRMQDKRYAPDSLFKMKTDGSGLTKLRDQVTSAPVVIDDWLYYFKDKTMHKTDRSATMDIELYSSDNWMNSFQFHDGWIYFIKGSFGFMGSASIEKIRIDGTGNASVRSARATSLYFTGSELYFPQSYMGDNSLDSIRIQ